MFLSRKADSLAEGRGRLLLEEGILSSLKEILESEDLH